MKDKQYLDSITVLRGLAALGVVFFHIRIFLWVGWNEIRDNSHLYTEFDKITAWLSIPTPFMGECVLLFFVISGFCVHLPHARNGGRLNIPTYAIRRFLRIYPPYLIAILLSVVVIAVLSESEIGDEPLFSVFMMLQNYLPVVNSQLSTNKSLWSIPTEVEFYLAYPIILIIYNKIGYRYCLVIIVILFFMSIFSYLNGDTWLAFCSITFYPIWWSGVILADLYANNKLAKPPGLLIFVSLIFLIIGISSYLVGSANSIAHRFTFGAFFIVLVWYSITMDFNLQKLGFIYTIINTLGNMSYSLYLIHYPLLMLVGNIWFMTFQGKPTNFLICIMFAILTCFISYLFYLIIELPSHRLAKKLALYFK